MCINLRTYSALSMINCTERVKQARMIDSMQRNEPTIISLNNFEIVTDLSAHGSECSLSRILFKMADR
jgi:hypothetical protein